MSLNMLQIDLAPGALLGFLRGQGLSHRIGEDLGYGVHAWLTATFGQLAPTPFRLQLDANGKGTLRLLAYSDQGKEALLAAAKANAQPDARQVCEFDADLRMARLPETWTPGREFGFEVLLCPVARKSRSGVEKDAFLQRADHASPTDTLDRGQVYAEWLGDRLAGAAVLRHAELRGFLLVGQTRATQRQDHGPRTRHMLRRPEALMAGRLQVADGTRFERLLARGVGRHRAFGYGMLLLRPLR